MVAFEGKLLKCVGDGSGGGGKTMKMRWWWCGGGDSVLNCGGAGVVGLIKIVFSASKSYFSLTLKQKHDFLKPVFANSNVRLLKSASLR